MVNIKKSHSSPSKSADDNKIELLECKLYEINDLKESPRLNRYFVKLGEGLFIYTVKVDPLKDIENK